MVNNEVEIQVEKHSVVEGDEPESWLFPVSHGLLADVGPITSERKYGVGEFSIIIPVGDVVADMDFTPIGGMPHFIPEKMTEVLRKGLLALNSFYEYIDSNCNSKKRAPTWLVAEKTNKRMATFLSRRLGFDVIELSNPSGRYVAVGKSQDVREKLRVISLSSAVQKLMGKNLV